jgi:hypothetical protein
MARPEVILPRADPACGKVFYSDRRTADGHRIALEVWNRATGRVRAGYRLAVFRCRRCGGFHLGQRPIGERPRATESATDRRAEAEPTRPTANHGLHEQSARSVLARATSRFDV